MTTDTCRITIHMVSSLDGMIAKKDNSISWFDSACVYEKGVTMTDTAAFLNTIDCYIMGAHTYEHALELSRSYGWAYGDTPTVVLTHRNLPVERPNIEFYSGDLTRLVYDRLKPKHKNVWLVGGPILTRAFIHAGLANEIRLTVLPVILGDGTPFFDHIGKEYPLQLKDVTAYKTGMVELHYALT